MLKSFLFLMLVMFKIRICHLFDDLEHIIVHMHDVHIDVLNCQKMLKLNISPAF